MKFSRKKIQFLLTIVILINAEILSAGANFKGTASGIFVNPYGTDGYGDRVVYQGVGTDTFTCGNSGGRNQLSFQGTQFNVNISTPGGYIFGSGAQSNRTSFSLGTLSYRNARTRGNPKGVYLDVDVQLNSPSRTNTKTISTKLDLVMTMNDGDKYHNADYLYLSQDFAPITLLTQAGVPITIEPFGFAANGVNGFTRISSFHVFEDESDSAELLAHITSPCESIVRNAVKLYVGKPPFIEQDHAMGASFIPNFDLSIDKAAKLCGYRGFNWYQVVVDDPYGIKDNSGNMLGLGRIYVDPPRSNYPYSKSNGQGNFPYYLDPTDTRETTQYHLGSGKNRLYFSDIPRELRMKPNKPIKFVTSLVGLKHNDQYDILYTWKWQTNWNGGNSGDVSIRSIHSLDNVGIGGTGGTTIIKKDLSAIDLPFNVRKIMQDTGATNVETYADLLPVPLLIPVLFD